MLFVMVTAGLVWLIRTPSVHIQSFVSRTRLHIQSINSQLNVLNDDDDMSEQHSSDLEVDAAHLELLGFVTNPRLFTQQPPQQTNESSSKLAKLTVAGVRWRMPPLVTVFVSFGEKEHALVDSKLIHFRNDLLIVYDIDLSSSEQLKVKKLCNVSCVLRTFKSNK
jgi:hypothetical protein